MLTEEEVKKIAKLARLELTPPEIKLYQQNLTRVLDYVKDLSEVKTEHVDFVRHVPVDAVPFREDIERLFPGVEMLMKNAPASEAGCYLLPAILEPS